MKKIILFSFLALTFFVSCNEKDMIDNNEQVGISKITYYAILSLQGSDYVAVEKGATFTDPGAKATAAGADVPVTTSGTVDKNTVGVYVLTYTAINKDGFPASIKRYVAVYSTDATAAANDLSGNYARTSNGSVAEWTKFGPGVYKVFNPGGAPGTNLTVIAFNPTGFTIRIPTQFASDGSVTSSKSEVYTNSTPPTYSWAILNPTYGTSVRTFIKK
jgi:hypothetical protein